MINVFEVLLDLMKAGIQHHRLGFEIAQQYHQHVTLAPMTEAFSDRQFLIVQREKEALVGGGESGGQCHQLWKLSINII
ncbi:hypothetical protein M770_33550 (plasmid) [Pseudomonas aeruginosa VRFPA03]|nr:hypothetical protein M770_33550 [Pseudomonas aeruginosa VRFPA03]